MAIKQKFNLVSWQKWDEDIKKREPKAIEKYRQELADEIMFWSFIQFMFFNKLIKLFL